MTIDFEGAYAVGAGRLAANMARLAATGAIGCNFEDQVIGGDGLHPTRAPGRPDRRGARGGRRGFLHQRAHRHLPEGKAARRMTRRWSTPRWSAARAYAEAGASGFFVPVLADLALLERFCAASPLPVNFMAFPGAPSAAEVAAGRRRPDQPRALPLRAGDEGAEGGGGGRLWLRSPASAGLFYKVADPEATRAWYKEMLGIGGEWGATFRRATPGGVSACSRPSPRHRLFRAERRGRS